MNSDKYINEVDEIHASDKLKSKLSAIKESDSSRKRSTVKIVGLIAACLAVVIIAIPALSTIGTKSYSESDSSGMGSVDFTGYGVSSDESEPESTSVKLKTNRKIVKQARISITTKNLKDFQNALMTSTAKFGGYSGRESITNWNETHRLNITLHIPSDHLNDFLAEVDTMGTVNTKEVGFDDVTGSYVDNKARLESLETELEALLGIMKKADRLEDVISLQDRISQVRGEIESFKAQLKLLDEKIDYATVSIEANEQVRAIKTDGSFGSKIKEKFLESIYSIGDFFEAFAIGLLGFSPYLVVIAIVAAVVIIIIKKRRNSKK